MTTGRMGASLAMLAGLGVIVAAQPVMNAGEGASRGVRSDHAVGYYDARLRRVVLVGGAGDPRDGDRDTAWSWNGSGWDVESDAGPPSRVNAAAAYDRASGTAVIAGGSRKAAEGGTWSVVGDHWEGDGRRWRQMSDIAPRDHHALVEDRRGGVLLFGGIPSDRAAHWPADTWVRTGGRWTRVATDGPQARARTALAYDGRHRQVVLFGGVSESRGRDEPQTFLADTWTWDGKQWRRIEAAGPRGRYAHAMAFDERAGVVLLYGGAAAHRDAPLSDMWQWDGVRWTELALTGPTPGHRYQPVMVYDRARGRTLLHGGIAGVSDTWEWDGRRWRQVAP